MALLASLLNEFYSYKLPYFPVLEPKPAQKVKGKGRKPKLTAAALLGFLRRKDLDLWVSDLDRLGHKHKHIPKEILKSDLSLTELLSSLPPGQSVPVFNLEGKKVASWGENQLIQAMGQLNKTPKLKVSHAPQTLGEKGLRAANQAKTSPSHASENSRWLGNLLLQAFPWPLYACDLQGKTLFFNSLFEESVLKKSKMRNSLRYAEKYLIEVVRDLLAQSFIEGAQPKDPHAILSTYDKALFYNIGIVNLEEEGHVHGYFFIFQAGEDPGFRAEIKRRLASGNSLDDIIDEIESRLVFNALGSNGQNISHTAKALGIKRSTLQNKIRRLKIEKRFGPIQKGTIRRHRSSQTETKDFPLESGSAIKKAKRKNAKK